MDLFIKERNDIEEALNDSELQNKLDKLINEIDYKNYEEFIEHFYNIGSSLGYAEISRDGYFTLADTQSLYFLKKYNFIIEI